MPSLHWKKLLLGIGLLTISSCVVCYVFFVGWFLIAEGHLLAPSSPSPVTIQRDQLPAQAGFSIGQGRVQQVAYSPDGQTIAVATSLGVRLYDAATLATRLVIPTSTWARRVSWSPDSHYLVVSSDRATEIIEATTGRSINVLKPPKTLTIDNLVWSPHGRYVAIKEYQQVWVWDALNTATPQRLKSPSGYSSVDGMAWSPDGHKLAISYHDVGRLGPRNFEEEGQLYIWDLSDTPTLVRQWRHPLLAAVYLIWLTEPDALLMVGYNNMRLVSASDGAVISELPHGMAVSRLQEIAWSPIQQQVAMIRVKGAIEIYRFPGMAKITQLAGMLSSTESMSWSPTGEFLVASSHFEDGFYVWRLSNGALVNRVFLGSHPFEELAWSPDSQTLAAGSRDNNLHLYSAIDGRLLTRLGDLHPNSRPSIAWSPDGEWIVGAGINGEQHPGIAQPWSMRDHRFGVALTGAAMDKAVRWSPTGNYLATMSRTHVQMWDLSDEGVVTLSAEWQRRSQGSAMALDWSPDGERLVVGDTWVDRAKNTRQGSLVIFQANDFQVLQEFSTPNIEDIRSVAWSPNGSWLAVSYYTACLTRGCAKLQVWSAQTGQVVRSLGTYETAVNQVSWSPDSQWLVAPDGGGSGVLLCPMLEAAPCRTIEAHQGRVEGVAWSPDGQRIASAGTDGVIYIWNASVLLGKP